MLRELDAHRGIDCCCLTEPPSPITGRRDDSNEPARRASLMNGPR